MSPFPPINPQLDVNQIGALCPDLLTGMHSPAVVTISGGQIYKFAQSKFPPTQQVASPWWFLDVDFKKIQQFFQLNQTNLGFLVRLQAAVKYEWSELDTMIVATVQYPIRVFVGPGTWQVEFTKAGSQIIFQAPQDLQQMYIPGIVDRKGKCLNADGQKAIGNIQYTPIASGDRIDQEIMSISGKTIVLTGNPTLN